MAEVVGIAASIVTLVGLVRTTVEIARQGSKPPKQLEQVSQELEESIIQLELLQHIRQYADVSSCLGTKVMSSLHSSLNRNIAEFKSIESSLKKLSAKYKGTKGRISWVLVGKDETLLQLKRLQDMRAGLNLSLSLVVTAFRLLQIASMEKADSATNCPPTAHHSLSLMNEKDMVNYCIPSWPRDSRPSTTAGASFLIPSLGRVATSFLSAKSSTNKFELAFWLALPFSQTFIVRTLLSRRSWFSFSFDSSFRVHRIVEETSPLHQACRSGEILEVRRLLLETPAAINDRTSDNKSLLQVAIHSRDCSIVSVLLEHGADVNELFGHFQTSPLAVAIKTRNVEMVRLLLKHKADCQHIGSYGWTPLFFLWWVISDRSSFEDQAEIILQILASRDDFVDTYSGVLDTLGFAAIHMAVMRGTVSQMRFLLSLDPGLAHVRGFLDWTAIYAAVSEGRLDMFKLLLPYYDKHDVLRSKDARGWTLLHTSAAEGESDVTQHLLRLGANWQALSSPSTIEVPEPLKGRSFTPLEAASATSLTKRVRYLRDVKEICGEICLTEGELEEVDDEWTDAQQ